MSEVVTTLPRGYVERSSSSSLADVVDSILDKGLVIDAFVRVSVLGIELITIDARIVIASIDTYLRFAEATNRLGMSETANRGLPGIDDAVHGGGEGNARGPLSGVKDVADDVAQEVAGDVKAAEMRQSPTPTEPPARPRRSSTFREAP